MFPNLLKSILDSYRPDRIPVGPITFRYGFKNNAIWVNDNTNDCTCHIISRLSLMTTMIFFFFFFSVVSIFSDKI